MTDENKNNNKDNKDNNYSKFTLEDIAKLAVIGALAFGCFYRCYDCLRTDYLNRHQDEINKAIQTQYIKSHTSQHDTGVLKDTSDLKTRTLNKNKK